MKKILIIQTAFIGDVILATSLVEKLASSNKNYVIHFLLRKGNESLLNNNPLIDKVLIWDKKNKISNLIKLLFSIRKEQYDSVINLQRFFSTGFITAFSGANETVGFDKNPLSFLFTKKIKHNFGNNTHEVERNLNLIKHLTDSTFQKPKLYPSEKDFESVKCAEQYITISPSSVWFTKQYPKEKWISFLNKLDSKLTVFILGGKSDFDYCNSIKQSATHSKINVVAGEYSFLESAALMKGSQMNYVNDSAPLHLCSAVNAPVTALFCSTSPSFGFTPLSDISIILESKENLPCKPCGMHGKKECPEGHFKCGDFDIPLKI